MRKSLSLLLTVFIFMSTVTPISKVKSAGTEYNSTQSTVIIKDEETDTNIIWDGTVAEDFESGSGTKSDPFIICTASQLAYLAQEVNSGRPYSGKYFLLTKDIKLNDTSSWENWGEVEPRNFWTPIGVYTVTDDSVDCPFSGIFDGNGHTVSGVYVNTTIYEAVGLFGYVEGTVKNTVCTESRIYRNSSYANACVGGLVGRLKNGTVENCCATGDVYATGDSHCALDVGGLVGANSTGTILCSFATGNIFSNTEGSVSTVRTGGLVGWSSGVIVNCYSTGNISASNWVSSSPVYAGGLVGSNVGGTIKSSYSLGNISAVSSNYVLGGLLSYNTGTLTTSYATGNISATTLEYSNYAYAAGLLGFNSDGSFSNTHRYSGQIITIDDSTGATNSLGAAQSMTTLKSENFCINRLSWSKDNWYFNGNIFPQLKWSYLFTVRFVDWDGTLLKQQEVEKGSYALAPYDPERTGYTFVGWDKDFSCVTADLTVTAQYEINTCTVIFKDWDGVILDTQSVDYGSSATAPPDPVREGYIFVGWDKPLTNIVTDLTIIAQYKKIEEVRITMKYSYYYSYIGEEFTLEYTTVGIEHTDVYWTTSDESIATVDENGFIHSLAKGVVAISVVSNDGKHFATCNVTVHGYGDADDDGQVNTADAVKILKLSAGIIPEAALNIHLADANRDGVINTADAVLILKYAAGLIPELI